MQSHFDFILPFAYRATAQALPIVATSSLSLMGGAAAGTPSGVAGMRVG